MRPAPPTMAQAAMAAALACALLSLAWMLREAAAPFGLHTHDYAAEGEALLHRIADPERPLAHLPAFSVLRAELEHWRVPPAAVAAGHWAAAGLLLAGAGAALGGAPCALLSLMGVLHAAVVGGPFLSSVQPFYALTVLLTAALLAGRGRPPSMGAALALAASVGAGLLCRSALAFLPPLLALAELRRGPGPRPWRRAAVVLTLPYLFLAPWVLMNWKAHGRFIPFESGQADSNIVTGALGLLQTINGDWRALVDPAGLERSGGPLAWAAAEALRRPLSYLAACAERLAWTAALQPPLVALALVGAWRGRARPGVRAVALLAAYFAGIHSLMTVERAYFSPLWPVLWLLAASGAAPLLRGASLPAPGALDAGARRVRRAALAGLLLLSARSGWALLAYALDARPAGLKAYDDALRRQPGDAWLLQKRGLRRMKSGDPGGRQDLLRAAELGRLPVYEYAAALFEPARLGGLALRARGPQDLELLSDVKLLESFVRLRDGRQARGRELLAEALDGYDALVRVRGGPRRGEEAHLRSLRAENREWLRSPAYRLLEGSHGPVELLPLLLAIVETRPGLLPARLEAARAAALAGRRGLALDLLGACDGQRLTARQESALARAYLDLGEPARALPALRAAARLDPASPGPRSRLGAALAGAGLRSEALLELEQAARLSPEAAELRTIGLAYRELGEPGKALAAWEALAAAEPGSVPPRLELAAELAGAGRREDALRALRHAESLPAPAEERRELALSYQALGGYGEALRVFRELVADSPRSALHRTDLGVCLALAGRGDDAVEELNEALRADPAFRPARLSLDAVLAGAGRRGRGEGR